MSQNSEIETICFQRSPCGVLIMDKEGSILQLNDGTGIHARVFRQIGSWGKPRKPCNQLLIKACLKGKG